ncbi:MAG: DUF2157 domain-containing protein [Candidatus Hydrogenedentes bacterium]|nr:DUF2157 domain-containing protein [Candidatus Hydrogenedentota bacterium]
MSKRAIRWLYDELPELVREGVVSQETADRVRAHYGDVPETNRTSIAIMICSAVGATLIGLGVILVLAHNWEQLSRPQRAVLSFAPLVISQLLVAFTLWQKRQSVAWCEGTGTLLALSIGASIALVGQTYQIAGDFGSFMLSWTLLALPIVYLLNASVPAVLYMAGITAWCGYQQSEHGYAEAFWILAVLIAPHIWHSFRRDSFGIRSTWLSWTGALTLCVATGISLERSLPGLWILIYTSLFTFLYLAGVVWVGSHRALWRRPFRNVGGIGIVALAVMLSYEWPWERIGWNHYRTGPEFDLIGNIMDLLLLVALFTVSMIMLGRTIRGSDRLCAVLGISPIVALIGYVLSATIEAPVPAMLLYNGYLLALGIGITLIGIQGERLGTLNFGLVILAAWITARFFDSNMDFVTRGLVFIVLGIGFLVANLTMLRRKRRHA